MQKKRLGLPLLAIDNVTSNHIDNLLWKPEWPGHTDVPLSIPPLSPTPLTASVVSLTYSANRHSTTDGWNMLALWQLQSEVNSLVWRHDNFHVPNANNTYQDNAVITLQSGYFIEGRDAPIPTSDRSDRVTITHLTGPDLPECILTWEQSNFSLPGEDTVGSMGCYVCRYDHFTTEHQSHTQPHRQQRQQPPPNYPNTICTSH